MKLITALIAGSLAAAAYAAPRESVTFTAVTSNGHQGSPLGTTLTHVFAGSDGGGSYTAQHLTIAGSITEVTAATFQSEAVIMITPPTGTPFIAIPINVSVVGTAVVDPGTFVVPVSAVTTAGTWTFAFFERFNDGGDAVDSTWDSITFTLEDAPAPQPVLYAGPLAVNRTNINVDGVLAAPGFSESVVLPAGTTVHGIRVSVQATATNLDPAATAGSPTSNIRVRVTPPGAAAIVMSPVPLAAEKSTVNSTNSAALAAPMDSGGNWLIEVYSIDDNPGIDSFLHSLSFEAFALTPPVATALGATANGVELTGTASVAAGQTKWFTFVLTDEISAAVNRALEIDTEGSPVGNTSMALYRATGTLEDADTLDGTDSLATLTYGSDNRPAPGNGLTYNGRDGAVLAAGTYYLAVSAGDTGVTYGATFFNVTNTSALTGDLNVHVRFFEPGVLPPTATDVGTIAGTDNDLNTTDVITHTIGHDIGQVVWMKFTINETVVNDGVAGVQGLFLDIDTAGTGVPGGGNGDLEDTQIGVYRANGGLEDSDDDSGPDQNSQISYGDVNPARPLPGNANGVIPAGSAGALAAGTYYLALGNWTVTFGAGFNATTTNAIASGDIVVNFRTNLPRAGCSTADIGVQGGVAGSDNLLDNNDFIVFIANFFGQVASADIGVQGGVPGHDSAWDNNDFIVYIGVFFTDSPNCTGNP